MPFDYYNKRIVILNNVILSQFDYLCCRALSITLTLLTSELKLLEVKASVSLFTGISHRATEHHLPYGITNMGLLATQHKLVFDSPTPKQWLLKSLDTNCLVILYLGTT